MRSSSRWMLKISSSWTWRGQPSGRTRPLPRVSLHSPLRPPRPSPTEPRFQHCQVQLNPKSRSRAQPEAIFSRSPSPTGGQKQHQRPTRAQPVPNPFPIPRPTRAQPVPGLTPSAQRRPHPCNMRSRAPAPQANVIDLQARLKRINYASTTTVTHIRLNPRAKAHPSRRAPLHKDRHG